MPEADVFIPAEPDVSVTSLGTTTERNNLVGTDEDTDENIRKALTNRFDRYRSEMEEIHDLLDLSDYAYKAGQNRTMGSSDKTRGANLDDDNDPRAQTGSTLFFRQVRTQASQFYAVYKSKDMPYAYEPIVNRDIFESSLESREQATMHNMMAKWVQKQDNHDEKTQDFAEYIYKNGAACEVIFMERKVGTRNVRTPKYEYFLDDAGNLSTTFAGFEDRQEEFLVRNYPSIFMVPIQNVYCDINLPWRNQTGVFFLDVTSYTDIMMKVETGEYSLDVLTDEKTALKEVHLWDGVIGGEHREQQQENEGYGSTKPPVETGQFLRWNAFMYLPLDDSGKWDDQKAVPRLYWITCIGNSLDEGIIVRIERNPDPDDEIPGNWVNCFPGDPDQLMHVSPFQIIRSNYSVECTFKNIAIDTAAVRAKPPIVHRSGYHRVKDFTIKANATWDVDDMDAIKFLDIPDNTQLALGMLEYMQTDTQRALATDTNLMGESFGARTSASEAQNIFQSSQQPNFAIIRYIMNQRERWHGRKIKTYIQTWGEPEQIAAITDSNGDLYEFNFGQLHGEFDIEVKIVDEYQDSALRLQALQNFMQVVSSSEAMLQRVDVGELVRMTAEEMKLPTARLILPTQDYDARQRAREENSVMASGEAVEVLPEQNHPLHVMEHKAARLEYTGVEAQFPQAQLLDEHIAEHEAAMQSQRATIGAPAPAGTQNQSEGEAVGNQLAAAQGGIQ